MGFLDSLIKGAVNSAARSAASTAVKSAFEQSNSVYSGPKAEADFPKAIGCHSFVCYYAIKGETPESVIRKLGLQKIREANWADGIKTVLETGVGVTKDVFVSPKLGDFVLAISSTRLGLDETNNAVIKSHASKFGELQTFGWGDGAGYYHYAKYANGQAVSAYLKTDNGIFKSGSLTPEERSLNFDKFVNGMDEIPDDFDWDNSPTPTPGQREIWAIAKAWGVDPNFTENKYEKGVGFICK